MVFYTLFCVLWVVGLVSVMYSIGGDVRYGDRSHMNRPLSWPCCALDYFTTKGCLSWEMFCQY